MSCFSDDLVSVDLGVCHYRLDVIPIFQASLSWPGRFDHSELGEDERLGRLKVGCDSIDHSLSPFRSISSENQISSVRRKPVIYRDDAVSGF